MQQFHGLDNFHEHAVTSSGIRGRLEALQRNGWNEVFDSQHLISKSFVDQSAVGEAEENTVVMLFTELDNILLAHQRFAAGVYVQIDAHLLALADDVVDLVKAQVQLVAILRCPAACTVQIAGGGGIQQDRPGNVAVILVPQFLLFVPADQIGINEEIDCNGGQHLRIHIVDHVAHERIIGIVRIFDSRAHGCPLAGEFALGEFIRPVDQFRQILFRIFIEVLKRFFQS